MLKTAFWSAETWTAEELTEKHSAEMTKNVSYPPLPKHSACLSIACLELRLSCDLNRFLATYIFMSSKVNHSSLHTEARCLTEDHASFEKFV